MEMDQFVEEIQYEEARAYMKTVLSSLLMYRKIYHGNAGAWIDQTIKRRYARSPISKSRIKCSGEHEGE